MSPSEVVRLNNPALFDDVRARFSKMAGRKMARTETVTAALAVFSRFLKGHLHAPEEIQDAINRSVAANVSKLVGDVLAEREGLDPSQVNVQVSSAGDVRIEIGENRLPRIDPLELKPNPNRQRRIPNLEN